MTLLGKLFTLNMSYSYLEYLSKIKILNYIFDN